MQQAQEIVQDAREALKRRNTKKIESIFSSHLRVSHSCDLWGVYLQYVLSNGSTRDVQREALKFAYNKTFLSMESVDIKIRYLEMVMEEDGKEVATKVYLEMLLVPMLRVETLIELHRSYEVDKDRDNKRDSLFAKEEEAVDTSKALAAAASKGNEYLIEYVLMQMNRHPIYTPEISMYAIDSVLEKAPESATLFVYKALLLGREEQKINPEKMVNLHTKRILSAKGRTEYITQMKNYLTDAYESTGRSLAVLSAITAYQIDPEALLRMAPPAITKRSESFYLVFFSALLRHRDIIGVRKYLVQLTKEEKIGYIVYTFCAKIEGIIQRDSRNAGGIIISALKRFLQKKEEAQQGCISNSENAYRITVAGAKILLALGDVQRANLIVDMYGKESKIADRKKKYVQIEQEEIDPRLVLGKHQILFESGFVAALPLLGEFSYPEVYRFICRCYSVYENSDESTKSIEVAEKFIAQLVQKAPIRNSHNICSNVDVNAVIKLLVEIHV